MRRRSTVLSVPLQLVFPALPLSKGDIQIDKKGNIVVPSKEGEKKRGGGQQG
jgi:hypothetical protein